MSKLNLRFFLVLALLSATAAHAQVVGSPIAGAVPFQYFDNSGVVMAGGKICTYAAGTSTPLAAYTDSTLTVPQSNPVILNSAGRPQGGGIYIGTAQYKFVALLGGDGTCATGVTMWSQDHVSNGSTIINGFSGSISIVGTGLQVTVANSANTITLSLPSTVQTGGFSATGAGASIVFNSANLQIDGNGNLSAARGGGTGGNLLAAGFVDTAVWYGMKPSTGTPSENPGGGYAAMTYKGGASGVEFWVYDPLVAGGWVTVDLAGGGGGGGTVVGTPNQVTVTTAGSTNTISLPTRVDVNEFNALNTGAAIAFNSAHLEIDGDGNLTTDNGSGGGNLISQGYVDTAVWYGMLPQAAAPTAPGSGYSAITYCTHTTGGCGSGLTFWVYVPHLAAWSKVDLAGSAGGLTSINSQTGPGITIAGTTHQVVVATGTNTVTLSTPQSIDTTSNVTFASVIATGAFNSQAGTGVTAYTITNGFGNPFIVNGDGDISGRGSVNMLASTGLGAFRVNSVVVIDASRNATVNNLTVGGTCTGCATAGVSSATGTLNQISVNGGLGPVSGAVTFALPQSIGTSSSPSFNNVTAAATFNSSATGGTTAFQAGSGAFIVRGQGDILSATFVDTNAYKIGGVTVVDASRNASVVNLTISGTCSGCASAGVTSATGTINQILVNGGLGPISGAVTFSLPQSICTACNVNFSSLALGNSLTVNGATVLTTSGFGVVDEVINSVNIIGTGTALNLSSGSATLRIAGTGTISFPAGSTAISNSAVITGTVIATSVSSTNYSASGSSGITGSTCSSFKAGLCIAP